MSGHSVRQLCNAAADRDLPRAETYTRRVASFLLSGADPKASFISHEGFMLTALHSKTEVAHQQKSGEQTREEAKEEEATTIVATASLRNLLSCLMPCGKCGILSAPPPPPSASSLSVAYQQLSWWKEQLVELGQLAAFSSIVSKAKSWNSEVIDPANAPSVVDVTKQLSEAIASLANPHQQQQLPSSGPAGLQFLVFLVSARLEALLLTAAAQQQQKGPTHLLGTQQRAALDDARQALSSAIAMFEARRQLQRHGGVLRPFMTWPATWFSRGGVEPKNLIGECLDICLAERIITTSTNVNNNTAATKKQSGSRRQRDDDDDGDGGAEEEDHGNPSLAAAAAAASTATADTWAAFESKMKERMSSARSVTQAMRDDADSAFGAIPGDVEFMGHSSTARDVDRLVPTLRNLLFASSPFGEDDGGSSHRRVVAVALDREQQNSSSNNSKTKAEPRAVVPSSETAASRPCLERIALAESS